MMTLKKSTLLIRKGFTLIEMVIVIGIIAIILGFAIGKFAGAGTVAEIQKAQADMQTLTTALESYKIVGGTYPSDAQGLNALNVKPTTSPKPKIWTQQMTEISPDPWGKAYQYKRSGSVNRSKPEILTAGPDGVFGNDDDISSQN